MCELLIFAERSVEVQSCECPYGWSSSRGRRCNWVKR